MGWCAARRETLLEGRQEEGHKVGGLLGNPRRKATTRQGAGPTFACYVFL